ncbi:hypothetical protein HY640_01015 [Candidatus Woesearchaeota archaeon]|nr:hypothetical protein [Candidatus Woesearchaeota archaeon]
MRLLLIALILLSAGCQERDRPYFQEQPQPTQATAERTISELERQLTIAQKSGGIHPDTYAEINRQISELEADGKYTERVQKLRDLLSNLEVGGQEKPKQPIDTRTDHKEQLSQTQTKLTETQKLKTPIIKDPWSPPSTCTGETVEFTNAPISLSHIRYIVPMGQMSGSHVTPTDHGYIINSDDRNVPPVDLFSPADGYILEIGAFDRPNDYRMVIWHSCTVATIYIHISELAPEILAATGNIAPGQNWAGDQGPDGQRILPIPVKAGQAIGKIRGGVDFSVHDTNLNLTGFVTPSLYNGEPWKIHTADLFEYFAEPLQSELKKKSQRATPPVGGKIDYDTDGRLIGNWFIEGTDYKGNGPECTYYECHLSFAYDNVNPEFVRVAIPNTGIKHEDCRQCLGAYGIRRNSPDPGEVSIQTGPVKYELVEFQRLSGPDSRPEAKNIDDNILGVLLVQMTEERRIKAEFFLGKKAAEVTRFTEHAKTYHRDALPQNTPQNNLFRSVSEFPSETERQQLPDCQNIRLAAFPVDMTKVYDISPLGAIGPPGHTFPTEHSFIHLHSTGTSTEKHDVYAPADAYITQVRKSTGDTQDPYDYTIYFAVCKEVTGYYNHIKEISAALEEAISSSECLPNHGERTCAKNTFAKIEAGAAIGKAGGHQGNFDFGLIDFRTKNMFANQTRYGTRSLHIQCPYDYYEQDKKAKFLSYIERKDSKPCGEIMQDIPETLQGNWFHDNARADIGTDWPRHLAFLHDNEDPETLIVSIGGTISEPKKIVFEAEITGTTNREFSSITPSEKTYCYTDGKYTAVVQLTKSTELKIEHSTGTCAATETLKSPTTYNR